MDISYKEPIDFEANLSTSLLGTSYNLEIGQITSQLHFDLDRTNAYLLGALDTKGEYQPRFADVQGLINFNLNEKLKLTVELQQQSIFCST